jgi:hypothetical protein
MLNKVKLVGLMAATFVVIGLSALGVKAQGNSTGPLGAWFGIARPCTPGSRFPVPPGTDDQAICRQACLGVCPASNFPVDEVTMIPNILADGTVLADDFAELFPDHHTHAQGHWESAGSVIIDGKKMDQYQATFIWFQARAAADIDPKNPISVFQGVVRPRFVTFYDPGTPDQMRGYIQPYLYTMTDQFGIVMMQPGTPYPLVDPVARLPATCDPTAPTNPYCLGTLHFVIRRINGH